MYFTFFKKADFKEICKYIQKSLDSGKKKKILYNKSVVKFFKENILCLISIRTSPLILGQRSDIKMAAVDMVAMKLL